HRIGNVMKLDLVGLREVMQPVFKPGIIVVNPRCINDEQELLLAQAVHIEVIDYSASFVTAKRVLPLAKCQFACVIGQILVKKALSRWTVHEELSHMRDIKQ